MKSPIVGFRSAKARPFAERKETLFALLAFLCSFSWLAAQDVPDAVLKAEKDRAAAIAKAVKTAVAVFGPGSQGGGSGVVITPDGYALTNFHVTKPCGDYMRCGMADGVLYDAVIVGVDPTGDVAIIKLLGRNDFPTAELADSDQVQVGDWCFAVGNPFLLATNLQPTVTYGIVSGTHRYQYPSGGILEYADCIQTDTSINPGNSGGPLFDAQGRVIGINGRISIEKRGRVNVGVGYAISINQIKHFMGALKGGRIVDHATLGAQVGSDEKGRVIVTNILNSSDAYRRGLRFDDEIVAFGGRSIETVNGFKNVLGIFPKGWRVPLTYRREGKRHDIWVRLAGLHQGDELVEIAQGKPKPEKDDKQPEKPGEPKPKPAPKQPPKVNPMQPQKVEVPEHAKKLIVHRTGYANYYFNELNRDRIWNAFVASGDFSGLTGPWKIQAELAGGGEAAFTLAEDKVTVTLPIGESSIDLSKDLDEQLAPNGSGGLLVALHVWQKLLQIGPKKFGEVYYHGTALLPDREPLVDVLVGTRNTVETHFQFDPQNGHLVGLEMYPEVGVDPCEILFSDYRELTGRFLPHRLTIRFGNTVYAELTVKKYDLPEKTN